MVKRERIVMLLVGMIAAFCVDILTDRVSA